MGEIHILVLNKYHIVQEHWKFLFMGEVCNKDIKLILNILYAGKLPEHWIWYQREI